MESKKRARKKSELHGRRGARRRKEKEQKKIESKKYRSVRSMDSKYSAN